MDVKCDFLYNKQNLSVSEIRTENYLRLDNVEYFVSYLSSDYKSNKGGNSFVYALYEAQTYDEDAIPAKVIKISNSMSHIRMGKLEQRIKINDSDRK